MNFYAIWPYLFQTVMRPIVYTLLKFFCRLEVKGLENIKEVEGNFILASNHINELDGFFLPAAIPLTTYFSPIFPVSRTKEFYKDKGLRGKFYGGNFFKFMGAYPAYSGLRNYEKSLKNQIEIAEDGHSVLIFPEGKVGGEKAKGGVGYLAGTTQKPVIPVRIEGIKGMTFTDFLLRRRSMGVVFKKPVEVNELPDSHENISKPESCKKVAKKIARKYREK